MRRFSLGKLIMIVGIASVLFVIGSVVYLLYSSRVTSRYQVYLRMAFDAAEVSDAGVCIQDGGSWHRVNKDTAEKLYYYMSSRTSVTLRRGARQDARAITLRIGDDIATITPISANEGDTAVIAVTLLGKSFRIKCGVDGLWDRLSALPSP